MEEEECLAFDDPQSDSNATAGGHSPGRLTLHEPGSLRETAVEVHAWELELAGCKGCTVPTCVNL